MCTMIWQRPEMHLMQLMTALADHIQRGAEPVLLLYVYLICAVTCKMSVACAEYSPRAFCVPVHVHVDFKARFVS